jgi:hypothetical protein
VRVEPSSVLFAGVAVGDYVFARVYTTTGCRGDVIVTFAEYPTGCLDESSTGISLKCFNASYGEFFAHPRSPQCTAAGVPIHVNVTGGCVDSDAVGSKAFGVSAGGSYYLTCVSSPTPYAPAANSLSVAQFAPQPTCPSSLYGPGNVVTNVVTYAGRQCIDVYGQPYSTEYDCNATAAFQNVYKGVGWVQDGDGEGGGGG